MLNRIIAIEGVDGVGKTSLCNLIKESLLNYNIKVAKTPYGECIGLTKGSTTGSIGAFCAYLISDIAVQNQFANYEWIILDRYILSTFVYHSETIRGYEDDLFKVLEVTNVLKPTATIYLQASSAMIKQRINERISYSNHKIGSKTLHQCYSKYLEDPMFQEWIGQKILLPSETLNDQRVALNIVSSIIRNK